MEKDEDIQITGTTDELIVQMLTDKEHGEEFTREYLKRSFLSAAVNALFHARRDAGLTQAQVAEKLNTKQTAIARLEADTAGSMSLRRFVEFALACGRMPFDIKLELVNTFRDYVIDNPRSPRTQDLYEEWSKHRPEPTKVSQPASVLTLSGQAVVVHPSNNVSLYTPESTPTVKSIEQFLKDQHEQNLNQTSPHSSQQLYSGNTTNTSTTSPQHQVLAQSLA
jgi:transcriptional regulator with XRE-family HTH domain